MYDSFVFTTVLFWTNYIRLWVYAAWISMNKFETTIYVFLFWESWIHGVHFKLALSQRLGSKLLEDWVFFILFLINWLVYYINYELFWIILFSNAQQ